MCLWVGSPDDGIHHPFEWKEAIIYCEIHLGHRCNTLHDCFCKIVIDSVRYLYLAFKRMRYLQVFMLKSRMSTHYSTARSTARRHSCRKFFALMVLTFISVTRLSIIFLWMFLYFHLSTQACHQWYNHRLRSSNLKTIDAHLWHWGFWACGAIESRFTAEMLKLDEQNLVVSIKKVFWEPSSSTSILRSWILSTCRLRNRRGE